MTPKPASSTDYWSTRLREQGLRVTHQRLAALEVIDHHPHSSAEEIYRLLKRAQRVPTVTLQTVHGIVNDLTAIGLLRRIDLPGKDSAARYETRVGDNHHHIECVRCGRVGDVDCARGEAPCLLPSDTHGMTLLEAQVTYLAVCHECELTLRKETHA